MIKKQAKTSSLPQGFSRKNDRIGFEGNGSKTAILIKKHAKTTRLQQGFNRKNVNQPL